MSDVVEKFDMRAAPHLSSLVQRVGLRTALSVGGVCAVGAIAWFIYYMSEDEDDEFKLHKTSRNVVIKVEVKKEDIGMIIGRGGSNLKYIEKQTDTRINVDDQTDESSPIRTLSIRGTRDSVHNAETMVYSQINSQPVLETREIFIPTAAVGRVIGKVGTSIKEIIKKSNAKVNVENNPSRSEQTKVTIRGTIDQIALATELINRKVEEYEEVKVKMNEGISKRSPFRSLRTQYPQTPNVAPPSISNGDSKAERLISTSSDGSLTVFMSAVTNPEKFWVQIMNDRAVELDQLVEAMTDYYNQKEKLDLHLLNEINIGQVVAVLFHLDQKWYRAQVMNKTDTASLELYFVDYGDSVEIPQTSAYGLNPDFLSLRFQAIECSLANVKPAGDAWSEEAISCFEDLTHVAQWKPLVARVESYRDSNPGQRSGSPLPCVSLFDTSGEEKDVNISEELISRGLAVTIENRNSSSSDTDTLVEAKPSGVGITLMPPSPQRPSSVASYEPRGSLSSEASSNPNVASSMPNVSKEGKGEKKKKKF